MIAGAKAASAQWLLFTDADTVHLPGSLARALEEAKNERADLLSYSPEQVVVTFAERAVMPVIFAELAAHYPPRKVRDRNSGQSSRQSSRQSSSQASGIAAANGQYILVRRAAYAAVGGHAAVAAEILEDVALARLFRNAGQRLYFRYGGDAVRTRMYRNWAQLSEGWTKNLALLFPRPGRLALRSVFVWFVAWFTIAIAAAQFVATVVGLNQNVTWSVPSIPSTVYTDQFNTGTLNSDWLVCTRTTPNYVRAGSTVTFSAANINMAQSCLRLELDQLPDALSTGAEIQNKNAFGYGTYEYVMRAGSTSPTLGGAGTPVRGQVSACFTLSDPSSTTEIDDVEIEGLAARSNTVHFNVWKSEVKTPPSPASYTLFNPEAATHSYKFVWTPLSITFFVDGVQVSTTSANIPTVAAKPTINFYGTNSAGWGGLETPGTTYMYVTKFTYSSLANTGTISPTGLYTAPVSLPAASAPATATAALSHRFAWIAAAALLLLVCQLLVYRRIRAAHFTTVNNLLAIAVGLPMFAYLLLRSKKAHANGHVSWKGRTYRIRTPSGSAPGETQAANVIPQIEKQGLRTES
jgi:beta-glucanase (GH16 family)